MQKNLLNKSLKGLNSYIFGKSNEKLAQKHLKSLKYEILFTNYSSKFGEIDIIAKKEKTIYFIEVKSSKNYESEYYLTPKKLQKMQKTIEIFLNTHDFLDYDFCIGLIAINDNQINFIENIF